MLACQAPNQPLYDPETPGVSNASVAGTIDYVLKKGVPGSKVRAPFLQQHQQSRFEMCFARGTF